jgi:glucose/mannose-6-phosphate isomerase
MVTKGYDLPEYVNENTLVICSSYSGNTEETLWSFEEALRKNAKIAIITSGGKLLAKAQEHGIDHIAIPGGKPSPRACLGYSFVQQLFLLHGYGLISDRTIQEVEKARELIIKEQDDIRAKAEMTANAIFEKTPIIYTTDRMEAVAIRLRQQINENSKALCWHHVVPEMNHNELVGWKNQPGKFAVMILRNADDFSRNAARIDINKEVIKQYTDTLIEIWSKGDSLVQRAIYFVNFGDWISWYLSALRGVDAMEVSAIDFLKGELAKI